MKYWGYGAQEQLNYEGLIQEKYQGIRPAPGYPACPDHSQKSILFDLLSTEKEISVSLTESMAMLPTASVSGWYFAHPSSCYFGIGKIADDQVEDYAYRRGFSVDEARKWLSPNLT